MKVIQDIVHGYVELYADDLKIIDTLQFQRLKSIRQNNPFSVYPCANHTRFEHSLGVMHLGAKVFKSLNEKRIHNGKSPFGEKLEATVRYACLLHDVGHAPFSHYGEQFFDRDDLTSLFLDALKRRNVDVDQMFAAAGAPHEICGCILSLEVYGDILESIGIDFELFCRMIIGEDYPPNDKENNKNSKNALIDILNSNADVDRLDYILRDSLMAGTKLVALDVDRLISTYIVHNNRIAFSGRSLSAISGLIYGREAIYTWIVNHHVNVYTGCVLTKIMNRVFNSNGDETNEGKANGDKVNEVKDLYFSYPAIAEQLVDDYDVISYIRLQIKNGDNELKSLYHQLSSRQYYKPIWKNRVGFEKCIADRSDQNRFKSLVGGNLQDLEEIERIVADEANIERGNLLISVARRRSFEPYIMNKGNLKANPVHIIIDDDVISFEDIFEKSIYRGKEPKLPFVFIKGEEERDKFLKKYNQASNVLEPTKSSI